MENHLILSIGPTPENPRSSEGSFLRLTDGRIMFAYSRFSGGAQDHASSDIYVMYSSDEGESWTEPRLLLSAAEYGAANIMSVSLLRMADGALGIFHGVKTAPTWNRKVFRRSHDEGASFGPPVYISDALEQGYYVMNNDRVERLSSGRIIVPLSYHPRVTLDAAGKPLVDHRGIALFLLSDDDGSSWRASREMIFPPFHTGMTGLQETGVTVKAHDVLWAYNRTDQMVQYEYFSLDGGDHWTQPAASRFTSPDSPMRIRRDPRTGALVAMWNPIPNYNGRVLTKVGRGRTPLVYAVSRDDGLSWTEPLTAEDDPACGYSYPALFFPEDGSLLAAYCAGGPADKTNLARLNIRKLPLP